MVSDLLANAHLYSALGSAHRARAAVPGRNRFWPASPRAGTSSTASGCMRWSATTRRSRPRRAAGRRTGATSTCSMSCLASSGWASRRSPHHARDDYDADRDLRRLYGAGDFLTFGAGQFMLLWPGDAHMPGIDAGVPGPVRKVVVKIANRVQLSRERLPRPIRRNPFREASRVTSLLRLSLAVSSLLSVAFPLPLSAQTRRSRRRWRSS